MGSVLEINQLTRVEGHGSVRLYLEGSRVQRVELSLTDSPRLFESLLIGKSFHEVPEIVCRICSLCSTVHKVTALLAVEQAFGITVSPLTMLTRELIANGGLLQSHALHLYCLLLPDVLDLPGVGALASQAPELLKAGLAVKMVGNLIQETVGGRLIHPVNIRLGGLGQRVGKDALLRLKDELTAVLPTCLQAYRLFRKPFPFPPLPPPDCLALQPALPAFAAEKFHMTGGHSFPVQQYRSHLTESVIPYSRAKSARVLGREPTVGPLSRLTLGSRLCPEAEAIFQEVKDEILGGDIRGNNLARGIELCQAAERSLELIVEMLAIGGEDAGNVEVVPTHARGTAALEAPRGVLIHSYGFDDAGLCTEADVVTPTSLNQGALERNLLLLARGMEGAETPQLVDALERLVRCYDPCISCSVHVMRL